MLTNPSNLTDKNEVVPAVISTFYTVDSFADGISFGQHRMDKHLDPRDYYFLHLPHDAELAQLRSRYVLRPRNPYAELESHLMHLSKQGVLRTSAIYFGNSTDPFFPFEGKFDASMRFLELFQKYTPGMLVVQTRSPLVVIAMPVLRKLGPHAAVTIGVETCLDQAVDRYTPRLPAVRERLQAANSLRRLGVEVTIQVAPVLPYGDWRADASKFAELLVNHADYLYVRSITDGTRPVERRLAMTPLAARLAEDRKFHYLRPDSATPLITEIERLAPGKITVPGRTQLESKQLGMFAA
jgi:hypothetical protein